MAAGDAKRYASLKKSGEKMKNIVKVIMVLMFFVSFPSFGESGWSGAYKVVLIDTLDESLENKSYISLDGFSNTVCNKDRILLTSSKADHYKEMMSLVLSAFHSGSKINIYLSSSCNGIRVQLSK